MRRNRDVLPFDKIIAAKQACDAAQVVLLTYRGGHRIAKGEALFREIAAGGMARAISIVEIPVRDLDEAHTIEAYLARIAA